MISSEVQRTLVKSPPELWAELSDPIALARHLGDLGEIRITRVEPERKVEWETADASGIVLLKPSGWGTKVTLSVTRELPAADCPQDTAEPDAGPEPDAEPGADAGPGAHAEPLAAASDAKTTGPETPPAAGAEPWAAADTGANAPETPPAAEAEADTWAIAPEPEGTQLPDTTAHLPPAETAAAAEMAAAASDPVVLAPGSDPLEPPDAAGGPTDRSKPTRRGFFARLFGRRGAEPKTPKSESVAAQAPTPVADDEPEDIGAEGVEGDGVATEGEEAAEDAFPRAATDEAPKTAIEALQARYLVRPPASGATRPEPASQASARGATRPEPPDAAAPGATRPEAADEAAPGARPSAADAGGGSDLATELRAAEEAATEHVTAVLTATLDRLGAAHHRPFSRS